ncbi:MAG: iron chelate uptake ABC transporter family permease subunit [Candidatus Eremiobacteraeota bacterium]|nr:iron chelate uptake ABC transporter family permease subunit [Candidatus Eremiobacteraeota bacterium]
MERRPLWLRIGAFSVLFFLLFSLVFAAALTVGTVPISFQETAGLLGAWLHGERGAMSPHGVILFQIRLPRIILCVLAGAALSMAGTAFQALLRNPLADPYIIGTSSGAALGASLSIVWGFGQPIGGISAVPLMAFLGSLGAMLLVYGISLREGRLPLDTFLLSGVIVGAFAGALISLLMTVAGEDLPRIVFWLMGSFSGRESWSYVALMAPYWLLGTLVLYGCSHHLNVLSMGDEAASSRGLPVEKAKVIIIFSASLVTAAAVSVCGLVGFVGLMIPHVMRRIVGPDHRLLLVASLFGGAVFLMATDTVARTMFAPEEIPVGVITALCGAPIFFWIMKMRRDRREG